MGVKFTYSYVPNDVTALNKYLSEQLDTFSFLNFSQKKGQVVIYCTTIPPGNTYETYLGTIQGILNAFSNPPSVASGGIQTSLPVKMDTIIPFTENGNVAILSNVDLSGNELLDISWPSSPNSAANKAYVDAISAGNGIVKDLLSPIFSAKIDNFSLEFSETGAIRYSSNALGAGLTGGSGYSIKVSPNLSHVTKVGILENLIVSGTITADSGIDAANNTVRNLSWPINGTDAATMSFVQEAINASPGGGLSAASSILSVNLDGNSLEFDGNNAIRIKSTAAGTGLIGGGDFPLSVASSQLQITTIGTLTSLTVDGLVSFNDITNSTSPNNGSAIFHGGVGIMQNVRIGGSVIISGGLNVDMQQLSNVPDPQNANDAANKQYADSLVVAAGDGLIKNGTVISFSADNESLEITSNGIVRVSSDAVSTGLSGGSGEPIRVVPIQTQIVKVGTLDGLIVENGFTSLSIDETNDANSGSIISHGGIYADKSVRVGANLFVGNETTLESRVVINSGVDSTALGIGGLVLSNSGLSVYKNSHFGGNLYLHGNFIHNVATPTVSTDGANKLYVDSLVVQAGSGLSKSSTIISVNTDNASIEINSNNQLRLAAAGVGTGLFGGSGVALSVNSALPHVTSLGTLVSLSVNGSITAYSGINANNAKITNLGTPTAGTDGTNKNYVDNTRPTAGLALEKVLNGTNLDVKVDNFSMEIDNVTNSLRLASNVVGTGLAGGSGTQLSVIANQPQITTVGALNALQVNGAVNFLSNLDASSAANGGCLSLSGGLGVAKRSFFGESIYALADFSVTGAAVFGGNVSSNGYFTILNADDATSLSSGSLYSVGGAAFGKTVRIGGDIYGYADLLVAGNCEISGSTLSNSVLTGAFTVSGGVGISGNMFLGGAFNALSSMTVTGNCNILSACNVNGLITSIDSTQSTSTTTGAVVLAGGLGLLGNIYCGGVISAVSGFNANSSRILNVAAPTGASDAANRQYVDSLISTAGTGLTKSGNVFSVNSTLSHVTAVGNLTDLTVIGTATFNTGPVIVPNPTAAAHASTRGYVDSLTYLTAGTGLTKSSNTLSVNAVQTQITAVGILTGLQTSGDLVVTSGTVSTSSSTGAVQVQGGMGVTGAVFLANGLDLNSKRITNVATPINDFDVANKIYVDDKIQGITSKYAVTVATTGPITLANLVNGIVIDGITLIPNERVLLKNQTDLKENGIYLVTSGAPVRTPDFNIGKIVGGAYVFVESGVVNGSAGFTVSNPNAPADVIVGTSNITFVQFSGAGQIIAGSGIVKNANELSVSTSLSHVTSLGTLVSVSSSGTIVTSDSTQSISINTGSIRTAGGIGVVGNAYIGGLLSVTGTSNFTGICTFTALPIIPTTTPTLATHVTSKSYVDSLIVTAGTGLTKTGTVFSVNAAQSSITSLGTLTALTVSGTTALATTNISGLVRMTNNTISTNSTSGALVVTGGFGLGGAAFLNSTLSVAGAATFSSVVTVIDPVNATDAGNKRYIDGLTYLSAGTGLTKTTNVLSVNAVQTQITQVGTLVGLTSSGVVAITNSTAASSSSGALAVTGGILSGSLYVSGNSTFVGSVIVPTPVLGNHAATADYVMNNVSTAGTGLTKTGTVLSVNTNLSHIVQVGTLSNLTVGGILSVTDSTQSNNATSGCAVFNGGIGINGNLNVGGNTILIGTLTIPNPTLGGHGANKTYVDSLISTAGTGLTKTGNVFSVNTSLAHVVQVGTLNSLNVTGSITSSNLTTTGDVNLANVNVSGNSTVTGDSVVGKLKMKASTSGNTVALKSAVNSSAYEITLPNNAPTTSGQVMQFESDGSTSFGIMPFSSVFQSGVGNVTGVKTFFATAVTNGGIVTVNLTLEGTSTGTAYFSNAILFANAIPLGDTTNSSSQSPWANLRSISVDRKVVTFTVLTGTNINFYGASVIPAPNGITCNIIVMGI